MRSTFSVLSTFTSASMPISRAGFTDVTARRFAIVTRCVGMSDSVYGAFQSIAPVTPIDSDLSSRFCGLKNENGLTNASPLIWFHSSRSLVISSKPP
ncbi:MAG: hypothetical protein QM817_18340 [Archangium sp.]